MAKKIKIWGYKISSWNDILLPLGALIMVAGIATAIPSAGIATKVFLVVTLMIIVIVVGVAIWARQKLGR